MDLAKNDSLALKETDHEDYLPVSSTTAVPLRFDDANV